MMANLSKEIYLKIKKLSKEGNKLFNSKNFKDAFNKYTEALELVPLPKEDWKVSTWLLTSIGDCFVMLSNFGYGAKYFYDALNCPDGHGNPFIYLRLGQCLYELNDLNKADEYLMSAYMLDGNKIFNGEDPKYLKYMESKYKL